MADDHVPATLDTSVPSVARVYDAFLGGKDNFAVDRELLRQTLEVLPQARLFAHSNRDWLVRVVRYLVGHIGIDQILDVGSGLPTRDNTHEVAQRLNSRAHVVYVDNDPACEAFGRALLEENERTVFVNADLREPDQLLAHPSVVEHLDFARPVALIHCGTLHHVAEAEDPRGIMATYLDALASGSYLALTHFQEPDDEYYSQLAQRLQAMAREGGLNGGYFRAPTQIRAFFGGLELVEPGLALLADWWPDGPRVQPLDDAEQLLLGGVGRKP